MESVVDSLCISLGLTEVRSRDTRFWLRVSGGIWDWKFELLFLYVCFVDLSHVTAYGVSRDPICNFLGEVTVR